MTRMYKTPRVLHLMETDKDGNKRVVRYYREDLVDVFVGQVRDGLDRMQKEADAVEEE